MRSRFLCQAYLPSLPEECPDYPFFALQSQGAIGLMTSHPHLERGRLTPLATCCQWVRGRPRYAGHPLPVVAVRSVPHIYRRADHAPGDPNRSCPVPRNHAACVTMRIWVRTKLFQGQQPKLTAKIRRPQLMIVAVVLPLELHRTQSHANPRVKLLKRPAAGREAGGEVVGRPPNHLVQFRDHVAVQVTMAFCQLPHFGLELLLGFVRMRRERDER